ncbi:phospholipase D family protein [Aquisalimonas sp.]|uniref:phospholipase D family protein n=1 Tax=unclassified Aquisalimonas TaxID=2644645 RepID=UPI0025B8890C|nr:phospholipase D family protein [Aquisalimonas sp.]
MKSARHARQGVRRTLRRTALMALVVLCGAWISMAVYHTVKPLPEGVSMAMPERVAGEARFLADDTWVDRNGARRMDHRTFDRVLELIDGAERLVVLNMFLFNDFAGDVEGDDMRPLSDEVTAALVAKKRAYPSMPVVLITDPMNTVYGGVTNDNLQRLEAAGVEVVVARLEALRDSNPVWSGLWRICCQWLGDAPGSGWLPNPVGEEAVPLRSLLKMLNFKANHRKTLIVDAPDGWTGLVTSANPHDASSAHSNSGVEFPGPAALDLLDTERAVLRFSQAEIDLPAREELADIPAGEGSARIQVLTESAILARVLSVLDGAESGDTLDLAMFYLSHRDIVDALQAAHRRGVAVRVLLDPNIAAFGREKDGVPNQPVAAELAQAGVPVRWCTTTGEQCHSKFLLYRAADGGAELMVGSANYTRRNLDDLNLETSVRICADPDAAVMRDAVDFFERRWQNTPERVYSLPFEEHGDAGWLRYWQYRLMEGSGMSTF